ncbi:MAG: hypothetical protein M0Z28_06985 [Rhodospirillales bacterium]|nr:hypothetical protein [Rhodospirillales bacterium]
MSTLGPVKVSTTPLLVAVAALEIVISMGDDVIPVIVEPSGIPFPLTVMPSAKPQAKLLTFVIVALPLVIFPVP